MESRFVRRALKFCYHRSGKAAAQVYLSPGANDLEHLLRLIHFGNGTPGKSGNLIIICYYCVFFGPVGTTCRIAGYWCGVLIVRLLSLTEIRFRYLISYPDHEIPATSAAGSGIFFFIFSFGTCKKGILDHMAPRLLNSRGHSNRWMRWCSIEDYPIIK